MSHRILIVEDEPSLALALGDDLRYEGYVVEIASDGEAGARLAVSQPFDLIVLDVMLPKKDGFDVCRDVRRAGIDTPILLLTARTHEAEKVLGFETGADDYVTKPYSARELRARVKALIRRGRRRDTPEVYRFGDAELDLARCELKRDGAVIELSALEYKLLAAFVRHRAELFPTLNKDLTRAWPRSDGRAMGVATPRVRSAFSSGVGGFI